MRRIRQISIKNLFGIFDHEIELNMDERVTIIHSPNGFGKTALLKILNELFTQGTRVIRTTPFAEFHIYFEDQTHFRIIKKEVGLDIFNPNDNLAGKRAHPQIMCYYTDSEGKSVFELELTERRTHADFLRDQLQYIQQKLEEAILMADAQAVDMYQLEFEERTETILKAEISERKNEQEWFQAMRASIPLRFIDTQRLLNATAEARSSKSSRQPTMSPTLTLYSEELARTITARLADSTTLSQSLDRTFPRRLMDLATSDIAESELRERLAGLEAKRRSLIAVGLGDQNANDAVLARNEINDNTKTVLSLYVEDTRQKLAIFDDIAPKIELLMQIINKHFLYKDMSISRKDGFVFTTPNGTHLELENLSSGEQHELVLFYELLFKALPGSLILIDEPEISLHVVWQEQFLRDVQKITRLVDIDVLIATHSPDIIEKHRELVVELEGPKDGGL